MSEERGATMLEYGLLVTFIAAVVVIAVGPFGVRVLGLVERGVEAFS